MALAAAHAFASLFTDANPPAAFAAVMHRYECVTLVGVRVDNVTTTGDEATVELTAAAAAELPLTRAPREFPPHWTLRLRRDGDRWRVKDVNVPEAAFAEALVKLDDPLQRFRALSEHGELVDEELCRRIIDLAYEASKRGDYGRAADEGELALLIAGEIAPSESARAQWMIGRAHDSAGDDEGSAAPIAEALRLAVAWRDRDVEARALVLSGWSNLSRREGPGAVAAFRKGLSIAAALHEDQIADEGYLGLGNWALNHADDFIEALRDYDAARQHAQRAGDRVVEAAATANTGVIFDKMSNYLLASRNLQHAIALYRAAGNIRGVMRNLRNLADVEHSASHFDVAERYVRELDELLVKNPNDRIAEYNDLTGAKVLLSQHRVAEAEGRCQKALERAERMHDEPTITTISYTMACVLRDRHRYAEAAELGEKIAARSLSVTPDFGMYWHAKALAGRALLKLGRLDEARAAFQDAIGAIERRRAALPGTGDDEQMFFSDKLGPYQDMAALALRRHDAGEALLWLEREQARTLLEALAAGKVRSMRSLTPAEQQEERDANGRIGALNVSLRQARSQEHHDRADVAALERQIEEARAAQEALASRLYASHPELSLARARVVPATLEEIQRGIPPDGLVLQYVGMEEESWVIAIAHEGRPRMVHIAVRDKTLSDLGGELERLVASGDLNYRSTARRMYDLLIAPAAAAMRGKKIVCIIPSGLLWGVPFQAMVDSRGRHFIERRAVFYAPSLTLLSWYDRHPRKDPGEQRSLLAVGNPRLTGETVQMARAVVRDEGLAPLPDAEREARRIAALFEPRNTLVLTGARATEMRVKREAGRYRILHFATHGVFNDDTPMYSHIALARSAEGADDGLLEAREIAGLDLHADLVVLAGCDTARGGLRFGEGVVGMSWAFLAAGCPRAVVTQWKIGSASAGDLMVDFHRRLARGTLTGRAATESLRNAQLKMLAEKARSHPFYWAGFVLMGRGW